ncbi:TIGR02679 family protein [Streptomyces sp. NPDC088725]|uniref:TIGR02679 family protein n=1 Tax=Streptomyces sp. NPDC088725 TaxID=3365873 RepID=UPI0037FE336D
MTEPRPASGVDHPALRPLWRAVHHRLSSGRPVSRVRVGPLDLAQREVLADLLGLDRYPQEYVNVRLSDLDAALADASGQTVREVAVRVIGPLGDRAADRERLTDERTALWHWLDTHEVITAQPALAEWAAHVRKRGVTDGSTARTRELLASALTTLAALPARGEPLPVLAARVLGGDAHALDDGTRLSSLILRALSCVYGTELPVDAQQRRALWSRAGVSDDELSTTVLAAGLRPLGDGTVSRISRTCAGAGQAVSLTLAQLRSPGEFGLTPGPVHVTENPSVLALALRRFGPRCPALICTSGWPNSAAVALLRLLTEHGATVRCHGDFDGEGLRIAAYVMAKTRAVPWRMTAADFRAAAARTPEGPPLGRMTEAPWDPDLAAAMTGHGAAVLEETVADSLLDDLSPDRGPGQPCPAR